jgi:hypothetical protein
MTSPETSYTKNVINELSILLVTHMIFEVQVTVLNFFWTDWCRDGILSFRGPR